MPEGYEVLTEPVTGPDGEPIVQLNTYLARRQKVTAEQASALVMSHQLRYIIFEAAKTTKEPLKLKLLAAMFEALEFEQQALWNFPRDKNFHRWFDFPGCTCPKLDNAGMIGVDRRIRLQTCPVHGWD